MLAGCAALQPASDLPDAFGTEPIASGPLAEASRGVRARFGEGKSGFVLLEENAEVRALFGDRGPGTWYRLIDPETGDLAKPRLLD